MTLVRVQGAGNAKGNSSVLGAGSLLDGCVDLGADDLCREERT